MENQIIQVIQETGIVNTQAEIIQQNFLQYFEQAKKWEQKAKQIVITDVSQVELMKEARKCRLALKEIRCNAENTRKELKETSLRFGKAVDGVANIIKALVIPTEEYLENQEKFIERIEEEKKEKKRKEREQQLSPYVSDVSFYNLKEMSEQGFNELFNTSKMAYEARIEAEKKAEQLRIEREQNEQEEREKMRIENERLKAEAEAKEKELAKERAEQAKKLEAERAKAKAEAEAKAKLEADIKAKELKEIEKQKKEAEAKKQAELAPDKEKLKMFAEKLLAVEQPEMKTPEGKQILNKSLDLLAQVYYLLKQQ